MHRKEQPLGKIGVSRRAQAYLPATRGDKSRDSGGLLAARFDRTQPLSFKPAAGFRIGQQQFTQLGNPGHDDRHTVFFLRKIF